VQTLGNPGRRSVLKKLIGTICAVIVCASASWAGEVNGSLRGTVDGRSIDVPVLCERAGGWLKGSTEPSLNEGRTGHDEGAVVTISSSPEMTVFTIKFGAELYRFNGTREVVFSETGLSMKATLHRYEGRGKDRKIVSSYDVDLILECSG
jgi:hypothetical protein